MKDQTVGVKRLACLDRRFASGSEEGEHEFATPLDVKAEAGFGLFLCILGAVFMFTGNVKNTDMIHSYQNKTIEQVQPRRNFRNIRRTRGKLLWASESIPSLEESMKKNPKLNGLVTG